MMERLNKAGEVLYWIIFAIFLALVIYEAAILQQPLGQLFGDDPNRPIWPLAMGWAGPSIYLVFSWWRQNSKRT